MITSESVTKNRIVFRAAALVAAVVTLLALLSRDVFKRDQVASFVKSDIARTKSVEKSQSTIASLSVAKSVAVVIVTHEASRVLDDGHGQTHKWENKVVHKETWIKTTAGWKLQRLEELEQVYLLRDGKPFRP